MHPPSQILETKNVRSKSTGIRLPVSILRHREVAIINLKGVVILQTRVEEVATRGRRGRRGRMAAV